jgi:hypothetical protein
MVNRDFSDLFAALNGADARFVIVGGHAVAFHADPRFTKGLDVWVEPSVENAARVILALRAFGAPLTGVSDSDFAQPGVTLQIGVAPNRIDITTRVDGVSFPDAWPRRVESSYGAERIWIIGRSDLVANKLAAGRPQDLADVDILTRHERTS